jgi:hypothetical protein
VLPVGRLPIEIARHQGKRLVDPELGSYVVLQRPHLGRYFLEEEFWDFVRAECSKVEERAKPLAGSEALS